LVGWLVGWSLTSLFSTNTAISETNDVYDVGQHGVLCEKLSGEDLSRYSNKIELDGPLPNVMAALPNIGGALCSTLQSLADAHYSSAVQ